MDASSAASLCFNIDGWYHGDIMMDAHQSDGFIPKAALPYDLTYSGGKPIAGEGRVYQATFYLNHINETFDAQIWGTGAVGLWKQKIGEGGLLKQWLEAGEYWNDTPKTLFLHNKGWEEKEEEEEEETP